MRGKFEVHENEEVRLTLPAEAAYARVARLAVIGLAARMGFSYDEIEDLRIAVGELCSVLLDGRADQLVLRCELGTDELVVEMSRTPDVGAVTVSALSRDILLAVVDDLEVDTDRAAFRFAKRRLG